MGATLAVAVDSHQYGGYRIHAAVMGFVGG